MFRSYGSPSRRRLRRFADDRETAQAVEYFKGVAADVAAMSDDELGADAPEPDVTAAPGWTEQDVQEFTFELQSQGAEARRLTAPPRIPQIPAELSARVRRLGAVSLQTASETMGVSAR